MEWAVSAKEMKSCDSNTSSYYGIPSLVLMERAALRVVEAIGQEQLDTGRILVVCGSGNNGGDGLAIARLLHLQGHKTAILLAGDKKKFTPDAKVQYEICKKYQIPVISPVEFACQTYTLIIDAIFGIGLSRNISGSYADLIDQINGRPETKLAVDIPSGISTENGSVRGIAIWADPTVTFAYPKLGLLFYPGCAYAGKVIVSDIGIDENSWLGKKPQVGVLHMDDVRKQMIRRSDGNKGTFGKVLLIAGSVNMAGAAYFAAKAAYRSGCGLVRIYTAEENRTILQSRIPEAVLSTYTGNRPDVAQLTEALSWADVVVIGPGLGTGEAAHTLVRHTLEDAAVPVVVDADALNIIAEDTQILLRPHTELVLTPHMGEMARLTGDSIAYLKANILPAAEEFARTYHVICVLKDARTVTAIPYGCSYLNVTGNDGMATGGSGDVLSGIIGGMIAQGVQPDLAAPSAVCLHGAAGDHAAGELGSHAVMASDIIEAVGKVLDQR